MIAKKGDLIKVVTVLVPYVVTIRKSVAAKVWL
jgi:hypothetical protein